MWTNGRRTKTNSKTSPEQSAIFQLVRENNKTNAKNETSIVFDHKENCPIPTLCPGGHFHDDWAKNVTSRKTAPTLGSHVIQLTGTSFELNSRIKETNVPTKFHVNLAKNVTSRVFTCFHYIHIEKNAPPTGGHVFSPIWTIFELVRDINKTNVLTNLHDDWAKSVTSSVFTMTKMPTGGHVYQRTRTTFELNQHIINTNILTNFKLDRDIIGTNVLTKFHEDRTKMLPLEKTAPPTGGHVVQRTRTTFNLNQHIIKTNILTNFELDRDIIGKKLLTKFHEDRKRNVPSRVFTNKCHLSNQETTVLTKFHEDWTKNVTSRVFTCFHYIHTCIEKNALPTVGHVFLPIWTIFELARDINKTNVLTNFHDDWAKIVTSRVITRKTAPPTGGYVFQRTGTTFELDQHITKTNILQNFDPARPSFELDRDFIGTKLLTKFHEDWTINVASRVFTNKCGRTDRRRTETGNKSSPEQSGELKT
ncbi:hypothetical protein DPMN_168327 [Dreissena polymorpha]|uniref:Uncharacterized protein n=1 Tax=Dreissena polymorpha TaxID=45954 RepID=A0A9D4IZH1_DREPO|nr:hypothetical protein DPMN_168327 [Dreissena polymorpha]